MNTTQATHSRAAKGGQFGANGEWYEGGKFINTVPENAKQHKKADKPTGKREVAPFVWEVQPVSGAMTLYSVLGGIEIYDRASKTFQFNAGLGGDFADAGHVKKRKAWIERYNNGERWR